MVKIIRDDRSGWGWGVDETYLTMSWQLLKLGGVYMHSFHYSLFSAVHVWNCPYFKSWKKTHTCRNSCLWLINGTRLNALQRFYDCCCTLFLILIFIENFWNNYRFTCNCKKYYRDILGTYVFPPKVKSCKTIL